MYNFLTLNYAIDIVEPYAIWGTVGVVVALLVTAVVLWIVQSVTKKLNLGAIFKKLAVGFVVFALVLGVTLLVMEICKKYDVAYLEENWVSLDVVNYVFLPTLVTVVLGLVSVVADIVMRKKGIEKAKIVRRILYGACAVALITTLIFISIYYTNNIVGDGYYTEDGKLNSGALYAMTGIMIVASVLIAVLTDKRKFVFDTKCLTFAGVTVALSFALSYIKLFEMPNGGSITLVSMLPVMIFAYMYGMKKGLMIGFIYGVLQALQDPYIIHPAQFLLDFPIAFAMLGFAGLLSGVKGLDRVPQVKFGLSALIGGGMRYLSHVLSGVFAFGAYAGDSNFWTYSLVYNTYVLVDVGIVLVVGILLFSSKVLTKEMNRYVSIGE